MIEFDWIIVGAGLSGATLAERLATIANKRVLVVEQRDHIGGNVWDELDEHGVLIHRYGPHIFHTNSQTVWEYLSKFTKWRPYTHRVLGCVDGTLIPLPFNLTSIERLFPKTLATRLTEKLISTYGFGKRVPILQLRAAEDDDLVFLAEYVYSKIFVNYTEKQWGMTPDKLQPSVTARVPLVISYDDRYFSDTYQAMPLEGYGRMVRNMLNHKNIHVLLNTSWEQVKQCFPNSRVAFTGAIDEFFDFRHGHLPYRSLRFEFETHALNQYQTAAVINYPNDYEFTRITESKQLTGQTTSNTTVVREYPIPHVAGETTPYYPIPTDDNRALFERYAREAENLKIPVEFLGRLGDYAYYNMDQAVARALTRFKNISDSIWA